MPRAKKGQQKVLTLKKKTGLCTSRCYYCPTWNPFDVRVTRNRSKDDNHAKPVPRKKLPLTVLRLRTQRGTASVEPVGKVIERGRSKEKEIPTPSTNTRG